MKAISNKNLANKAIGADPSEMYKPINGMNAEAIHAKAVEAKEKREAAKKK